MQRVVDAFREMPATRQMFHQAAVSFARTDDEAASAPLDQWRHCAVPADQLADLRFSGGLRSCVRRC